MKFFSFLLLSTICFGRGRPGVQSIQSSNDQQSLNVSDPVDMVTVKEVTSSLSEVDLPKTPSRLAEMFVDRFRTDPETAFVDLFDWEAIPKENRREMLRGFLSLAYSRDGSQRYTVIESETKVIPIDAHCRGISLTVDEYNEGLSIPISHVLEVTTSRGIGSTSFWTLDIFERDGDFYFYPRY